MLVDEFQDTSRAQWELVAQLVTSWGEGFGAAADALPPSIFIVGDRKQSIYGFRDADVARARRGGARSSTALRPDGDAAAGDHGQLPVGAGAARVRQRRVRRDRRRRAPTRGAARRVPLRRAGSVSGRRRCRPADAGHAGRRSPLGLIVGDTVQRGRRARGRRDRAAAGRRRPSAIGRPACAATAQPADIAILFRSRDSHREFEAALERRGVPTYVYKGLGFFDADEIQDAVALLRYLADPLSNLRAAALLRSRLVRLSDAALRALGADARRRRFSTPSRADVRPRARRRRSPRARRAARAPCRAGWRWVDRLTPAELLDAVLRETAYAYELRGPRRLQARENLKKLRGMIRRDRRTAATRRWRASPITSSGSPSATSRTRPSTRSTPSA